MHPTLRATYWITLVNLNLCVIIVTTKVNTKVTWLNICSNIPESDRLPVVSVTIKQGRNLTLKVTFWIIQGYINYLAISVVTKVIGKAILLIIYAAITLLVNFRWTHEQIMFLWATPRESNILGTKPVNWASLHTKWQIITDTRNFSEFARMSVFSGMSSASTRWIVSALKPL